MLNFMKRFGVDYLGDKRSVKMNTSNNVPIHIFTTIENKDLESITWPSKARQIGTPNNDSFRIDYIIQANVASVPVDGSIYLIFFCIVYVKYSKLVLGLNKILCRTHKNTFVEAYLINYHYIGAKPVPINFFRSVPSLICSFSSMERGDWRTYFSTILF